jgi:hypothetical protein
MTEPTSRQRGRPTETGQATFGKEPSDRKQDLVTSGLDTLT